MFETSRDILNIVAAVSILSVSFFLSWLLFVVIKALRDITGLVAEIKERFDSLHQTVKSGFNYLGIASEGVKLAMKYMGKDTEDEDEKPKRKRKKKK